MPTYDTVLDPNADDTSHAKIIQLVEPGHRVLDIGCATGYLAEALIQRGCDVSGVEYDHEAATQAKKIMSDVLVADLESTDLTEHFGSESFDSIIFGDVLEHMRDPLKILQSATRLIRPGGTVVISVPNITHGSVRLALLQGSWEYRDLGLLDRTHIHFFTRASLTQLITDAGLDLEFLTNTSADPLGVEVTVTAEELPEGIVDWVRQQPDALAYQFVLRARRPGPPPHRSLARRAAGKVKRMIVGPRPE